VVPQFVNIIVFRAFSFPNTSLFSYFFSMSEGSHPKVLPLFHPSSKLFVTRDFRISLGLFPPPSPFKSFPPLPYYFETKTSPFVLCILHPLHPNSHLPSPFCPPPPSFHHGSPLLPFVLDFHHLSTLTGFDLILLFLLSPRPFSPGLSSKFRSEMVCWLIRPFSISFHSGLLYKASVAFLPKVPTLLGDDALP